MRILIALLLETYAFFLTHMQMLHGVRTDEAKYLLNIPYPHPPGARTIFGLLSGVEGHEFFVRFFLATLLVQSVWFLWPCVKRIAAGAELVSCAFWLASGGIVFQAGTAMVSVLNAWQGLVLLALALRSDRISTLSYAPSIYFSVGLFWLWSLFTGYQAFLYVPLILTIYHRSKLSLWQQALYVFTPIFLLTLYSFSNPLALVRMVGTAEKDVGLTLGERVMIFGRLWWIAGSGLLSLIGTWGVLRSRRLDLIGAFLLLSSFIFLSNSPYYAILLTPLLLGGAFFLRSTRQHLVSALLLSIGVPVMFLVNVASSPPLVQNVARDVGDFLRTSGINNDSALIVGTFGHEWQYYVPVYPVLYTETLEDTSQEVVICRMECPMSVIRGRELISEEPVEVWVTRSTSGAG